MTFRGGQLTAGLFVAAALALSGCAAQESPGSVCRVAVCKDVTETATPKTAPATSAPAPSKKRTIATNERCIPLPKSALAAVASGAKKPDEFIPVKAAALKPAGPYLSDWYLIAVNFKPGPTDSAGIIAIFGSPTIEPGADLTAVNGTARFYTNWPDGKAQFTRQQQINDAYIAEGCVYTEG